MIRQLSGTVADISITYIVLDVGGVGYLVYTNSPTSYEIGIDTKLFTYLAVRENSLDLYGFADRDTLEVFELLIELPKIGPKSALQILTQADILLIKESVHKEDASYLSKLSGIGKKSAEKIVAGLKDKIETIDQSTGLSRTNEDLASSHTSDTIDALIALGYSPQDARKAVSEIAAQSKATSPNDLIKLALKSLNR